MEYTHIGTSPFRRDTVHTQHNYSLFHIHCIIFILSCGVLALGAISNKACNQTQSGNSDVQPLSLALVRLDLVQ
ncbi:hypothetical protein BDV26DRAFT_263230 [Aspergillus bertholletiae]|uniref:Uncharacterized protein n=1 Tax=Aspergillus bertholletiae TaxID=1226010 RepID=A0A5N7B779_9EURO|nr:hypothetical protein BDV26DRAFT_263230 [Aspergillus bertholletiae]